MTTPARNSASVGAEGDEGNPAPDALPHSPLDRDGLVERLRERIAVLEKALPDPDKLDTLALWLDLQDAKAGRTGCEVQDDLRWWSRQARAALSASGGKSDQRRSSPAVEAGPDGPTEGRSPAGWRDISSARQDGTRFLAVQDGLEPEIQRWHPTLGWATDADLYRDPERWMPLPETD